MSPLDQPILLTFFRGFSASTKTEVALSMRQMATRVTASSAAEKSLLPWFKCASFGTKPTDKGSLRYDANVTAVTGIEADYDAGTIPPEDAAFLLECAGIAGAVFTSPSHTDARPRWRVICPLSQVVAASTPEGMRERRAAIVGRLNGVLGGVLANESFPLSQAFYYGSVNQNPEHRVILIDGDYIDRVADLPEPILQLDLTRRIPKTPALPPSAAPDAHATAAFEAALTLFDDDDLSGQEHQVILAVTKTAAPFVKSGHLERDDVIERVRLACARDRPDGEIESALDKILRDCASYVPPTHGVEFPVSGALARDNDPDAWKSMLVLGEKRKDGSRPIKGDTQNYMLALNYAPALRGTLGYNNFTNTPVWIKPPPWDRGAFATRCLTDHDPLHLAVWMQQQGIPAAVHNMAPVLSAVADDNRFHPVRDWLATLTWDGSPRLDTWLIDYFGAADTPLNRVVGSCFLIGAVARVIEPGCKVDTMPIFEGRQGLRKSAALRVLAHGWFTDHLPDLTSKDAPLQIQGILIAEMAELDKMRRAEVTRAKAFMSTQVDRLRPPFGRTVQDYPRQSVFAGSVNPGFDGYLEDETGNRRYWPVECAVDWPSSRKIDTDALRATVPQLWSEAVQRYRAGEPWYIRDPEIECAQATVAAARMTVDAWQHRIADYLADKAETSVDELLGLAINKPAHQWTHSDSLRVGKVMKALNWHQRQVRVGDRSENRRERRFFRDASSLVTLPAKQVVTEFS